MTKSYRDPYGEYRLKVLYDDATVVLYPLEDDGSIGKICDIQVLEGSGPMPVQFTAHPHSVQFAPDGSCLLVCDKGGDQIFTYQIDAQRRRLIPCMGEPFRADAGFMPRYSAFHPTRPYVYTNNEGGAVLYSFRYSEKGELTLTGQVNGYAGKEVVDAECSQSDLRISANGKYLYSLLRGKNIISVFSINPDNGTLAPVQAFQMEHSGPRGCCIAPDGRHLLVTAVDSHAVVSYPIRTDGTLGQASAVLAQSSPCTVTFYETGEEC